MRCSMKKVYFKPYDFVDSDYYYKVIKTTKNSMLTFNSENFLVLKRGSIKNGNFKTRNKRAIELSKMPDDKKLCLLLKYKPYKIYQYVNESELKDVSDQKEIFGIKIVIQNET